MRFRPNAISIFLSILLSLRTFLIELETYTDCPELVGRCFLDWVSSSVRSQSQVLLLYKDLV